MHSELRISSAFLDYSVKTREVKNLKSFVGEGEFEDGISSSLLSELKNPILAEGAGTKSGSPVSFPSTDLCR